MKKFYASMMSGEAKGGQATTEYIVLIAILVLAAAVALYAYRDQLINIWDTATQNLFAITQEKGVPDTVQNWQRANTTTNTARTV